ncbi:MAG TPA: hypothetical protein VNF04_15560, partial [Stellaceae bacterium]|nr:hypothetical protein [Stellaceae bacterium]
MHQIAKHAAALRDAEAELAPDARVPLRRQGVVCRVVAEERFLGYPLVIFSGDQDVDGTAENFPRHDAAMAQGPN